MDISKKKYMSEVFNWLMFVIQMPALYYGRIPLADLYKIFQGGKDKIIGDGDASGVADIGEEEFRALLQSFLSIRDLPDVAGTDGAIKAGLSCIIVGDEAVADYNEEALRILKEAKKQRDLPHKILSYDEVHQIISQCYIDSPEAEAMKKCLLTKLKLDEKEAVDLIRKFSIGFRSGDNPGSSMNEIMMLLVRKSRKKANMDDFKEIIRYVSKLYNATGMMVLYGWSPNEVSKMSFTAHFEHNAT